MLRGVSSNGGSGGGVSSLQTLVGAISLTSNGGTIAITTVGNNINLEAGSGAVSSVSNSDGTLTISPTIGVVIASLALGHANTWTGQQTFNTSAIIAGTTTASTALVSDASKNIVSSVTTLAELAFVSGVTSSIQAQLNGKQASGTYVTSLTVASANGFTGSSSGGATPALTISTSVTGILSGNGTAISAASTTGSGAVVLATSPTLTTAVLGSSTATTQTPGDNSTKVATTAYVQAAVFATTTIAACKYATIAALPTATYNNGSSGVGATLTGVGLGALSIDGVTPSIADRILIKNQASTFQNGIYVVTTVGSVGAAFVLTRSADYNQSTDIDLGDQVFTTAGATLANTTWTQNGTEDPVIGTDPITFAQTAGPGSYTAGNGIAITGTSIAIDTSVTVDKNTAQALTNKDLTSGTNTFPTFNQNTTGSAAKLTTPRAIGIGGSTGLIATGVNFDGTAAINPALTGTLIVANGGTGAASLTGIIIGNGTSAFTTVTAPSGTIVGTTDTQTLTNKRITRRVVTVNAPGATPSTNTDNNDVAYFTGLNTAITSMTTNLSGTPTNFQPLIFSFVDDGTPRAISWGASFESSLAILPTTTVASAPLDVGFRWNTISSKWRCVAVA